MTQDQPASRVNENTRWEKLPCPVCGSESFEALFEKRGEPFVRCRGCSLIMINPRPHYDDIITTYNSEYGNLYLNKKAKKLRRIRPWVKKIKSNYVSGGRWLDIGCSVGFVVYCAKEAGFDAYGVDVEPHGLKVAREQLGLTNIYQGMLEGQGFADGYFNVISLYDVIEHVPDLNAFVRELKRLLAPGGIIDLRTPDAGHWRVPKQLDQWNAILPSEHLYNFSFGNLRLLLKNNGLEVVQKRLNFKPILNVYAGHEQM